MGKTPEELANAVMNYLYNIVKGTAGGIDDAHPEDPFISWCKPGIPFEKDDFRFSKFFLTGQGDTPEKKQDDLVLQLNQAAGFSRFVDFIPTVNGIYGGNIREGILRPGSGQLSVFYKRILESSQTAALAPTAEVNAKIKELTEQAKPLAEAYFEYQAKYFAAKAEYVDARLKALASSTAALEFQVKGAGLKAKVTQALEQWETFGSKTEYENTMADILSLRSKRTPALWRSEALSDFNSLPEGSNAIFGEVRSTTPFPGGFAFNESGWTNLSVTIKDGDQLTQGKSTKYGAAGSLLWGAIKLGGGGSGSTDEKLNINNTDNFEISLSLAEVSLLRNWFDPFFLQSEFWRFNPQSVEGLDGTIVSDGGGPDGKQKPEGMLVAYPVSAIFVKDVKITMNELNDTNSELSKMVKAEGGGGWGFGVFNVGGSYERNGKTNKVVTRFDEGTLTIAGLQLIGFRCELMSRSPNPKEGLNF